MKDASAVHCWDRPRDRRRELICFARKTLDVVVSPSWKIDRTSGFIGRLGAWTGIGDEYLIINGTTFSSLRFIYQFIMALHWTKALKEGLHWFRLNRFLHSQPSSVLVNWNAHFEQKRRLALNKAVYFFSNHVDTGKPHGAPAYYLDKHLLLCTRTRILIRTFKR